MVVQGDGDGVGSQNSDLQDVIPGPDGAGSLTDAGDGQLGDGSGDLAHMGIFACGAEGGPQGVIAAGVGPTHDQILTAAFNAGDALDPDKAGDLVAGGFCFLCGAVEL